jgi:hypothetical protein
MRQNVAARAATIAGRLAREGKALASLVAADPRQSRVETMTTSKLSRLRLATLLACSLTGGCHVTSARSPARPDLSTSGAPSVDASIDLAGASPAALDALASSVYPAPHPPLPQLPANQGGKLATLHVVFIVASGDKYAAQLAPVPQDLLAGDWFRAVTSGYGIVAGGSSVFYGGALASGTNLKKADLLGYIAQTLQANGAAPHPGNTIFLFFFPDGTQWVDDNGNATGPPAWHGGYDGSGDAYGAVQRVGSLQTLTELASHEILEAATDTPNGNGYSWPQPGGTRPWEQSVWLHAEGTELGDMCERLHWITAGESYDYARIWNDAAAAADRDPCLPQRAGPYYNVGAWESWVPVAAGQTVSVALHGWSTAPVADWTLTPQVKSSTAGEFVAAIESATHGDGGSAPTINNGGTATLTVTVAAGARSGDWAVVRVGSDATSAFAGADGLAWAVWPVGFYVP